VQASVNQLSRERTQLLVQSRGFLSPITDDMDPLVAPSQMHAFAEAGSVGGGVRGRWTLPSGLMFLAGLEAGEQDYQGVRTSTGVMATLAARYAPTNWSASRPLIEVGGLLSGGGGATFTRTYANGVGTSTGQGSSALKTSAIWGRAGWVWDTSKSDQLGAYAEYQYVRQSIGAYLEPLSQQDPFEALVTPGVDAMDVGKIGVRYNHTASSGWEYSGGLALAHAVSAVQELNVVVDGFGLVPAAPAGEQTWVEYGVHAGYAFANHSAVSFFVAGVAGSGYVGSRAHVGIDYRYTF
jgi:hypothetical protein